jgi:hypothetical protein
MERLILPYLRIFLFIALFSFVGHTSAQVLMSTTGATTNPNSSAVLFLEGNGNQGLVIPIVSDIASSTVTPAQGMVVFCTCSGQNNVQYYNGSGWTIVGGGGGSSLININGNTVTLGSGASSINLAKNFSPNPNSLFVYNNNNWEGLSMDALPTVAQGTRALVWNPTTSKWEFQTISGGGGGISTINKGGAGNFISITNPTGPITTINADAIVDGDISGTANISGTKLQDGTLPVTKLSTGTATNGQFLRFNAGSWAPATMAIPASVTNVTATAPLTSSGGTTPNISLSGTLPVANGGTGRTTWDGVLWGNGTGSITDIGNGTNGQVFTMQGTSPGWSPAPSSFTTTNVLPKGSAGGLVASQIFDDGTNVGIGTATPTYILDVNKNLASVSDAHIRAFNPNTAPSAKSGIRLENGTAWAVQLQTSNGDNWLELTNFLGTPYHRWTNDSYYPNTGGTAYVQGVGGNLALMGGNVGIGTISPTQALDVTGNINVSGSFINFSGAGNTKFFALNTYFVVDNHFVPNVGNSYDLGTAAFRWRTLYTNNVVNVSDSRLKKDILPLAYGLTDILKLRPVSYVLKDDKENEVKLGLIAQEVRKIVPEVVSENPSGEKFLGMNYTELIPVLIKATQEQQALIETQQSEITNLKKELDQIKNYLGMEAKAAKKKKSKK